MPTIVPSTGEKTSVPGAAPTSSDDVDGPSRPKLVPDERVAARPEDPVAQPAEPALVAALPERVEAQRPLAGAVVADRRDARLGDRELEAQRAGRRHDLGQRQHRADLRREDATAVSFKEEPPKAARSSVHDQHDRDGEQPGEAVARRCGVVMRPRLRDRGLGGTWPGP